MGLLQVRRSTSVTPEGLAQDCPLIDVGLLLASPTACVLPSQLEKQAHLPTAVQCFPLPGT